MSMAPTVVKPRPIQLLVDERVNNVRLLITKVVFDQEKTLYPAEMVKISDKKKRKKIRKICRDILEEIINDVVQGQQSQLQELTMEDTITYDVLGLPKTFGGNIRSNKRRKTKHQSNYRQHDENIENMDEQSAAEYWTHLYQTNPEYYYQLYYTYYPDAAPNNMAQEVDSTASSTGVVPMVQCMNSGGDSGSTNNNNNSGQSNTSTGTANQSSGSAANNNAGSGGQSGGDGEDNHNNKPTLPNAHATENMADIDHNEEKKIEEKSPAEIMDRKYSLIEKIMKEMTEDDKSHKEVDIERMQLMMEEIKDTDLDYEDIKEKLAKAPAKIKDNGEFSIFSGHRVVFESDESDSEEDQPNSERSKPVIGVVGEGVVEEGEHEIESSEDEDEALPPLVNTNTNRPTPPTTTTTTYYLQQRGVEETTGAEDASSESEDEPADPAEAAYEEVKKELETVDTKMNKAGKFSLFEGKHMVFSGDSDDEGQDKQPDADMTPVNIEPEVVGEGEIYSDEEVNEEDSEESAHEHEEMHVDVLPEPKPIELGKGHVKFDYGDSDSDSDSEDKNKKSSAGGDSAVVGVGTVEMNDDIRFYDEDDSDYKMSEEEEEYNEEEGADEEEEEEGCEEEENVEVLKDAFTQQEELDQHTEHRVDKSLLKYWHQRYSLFAKFDEGIQLDDEGWYSVTPEEIARHIAARMYQRLGPNATVIDAMVGVGGNTIQFATMFPLVFGIEMDPNRALMAKNNAEVYGVDSNIEFVIGDYTCLAPHFRSDAVFLSPPWGGPTYLQQEKFDITKMPLNGVDLFNLTKQVTKNIGYFLPRNTDASQLCQLASPGESCEIEQNFLYDKLKTITAYYGDLVWAEDNKDDANEDEENNDKDVK